jgi:hypothetical protein
VTNVKRQIQPIPFQIRHETYSITFLPWAPVEDGICKGNRFQLGATDACSKIGDARRHTSPLDFFKRRDYANIDDFVYALEKFEGRACGANEV